MAEAELHEDRLVWGHGPRVLEVFQEPTCPFSVLAFNKFDELLKEVGEDKLTLKVHLHSQPWHMFSSVIVRCVFAAATLPNGKAAAQKVLAAVGEHREEFEFEHHATGPNRDATPNEIVRRIEGYTGLKLMHAFNNPELAKLVKRDARYARQNGIHFSPTFMIDGHVQADMSSGEPVADWVKRLQ